MDIKLIRRMCVDTFPLPGRNDKSLHYNSVIIKQGFTRDIGVELVAWALRPVCSV